MSRNPIDERRRRTRPTTANVVVAPTTKIARGTRDNVGTVSARGTRDDVGPLRPRGTRDEVATLRARSSRDNIEAVLRAEPPVEPDDVDTIVVDPDENPSVLDEPGDEQ